MRPDATVRLRYMRYIMRHVRQVRLAPTIYSSYALRFVTMPPSEIARPREGAGLWDGFNYLLKIMTDVWRLPLPTASDPFFLRWFEPPAGSDPEAPLSIFCAEVTSRDRYARPLRAAVTCGHCVRPLRAAVTRGRYVRPLREAVTRSRYVRPLHAAVTCGRDMWP